LSLTMSSDEFSPQNHHYNPPSSFSRFPTCGEAFSVDICYHSFSRKSNKNI
jgi:hypothetical protein